jgi:hypothetical protein
MRYTFSKKEELIKSINFDLSGEQQFNATCIVRNDKGAGRNERPLGDPSQVVYAMTGDRYNPKPYMPQPFPVGAWNIKMPYAVDPNDKEYGYKGPWMIPTDAWQMVQVWSLDAAGGYYKPTDEWVKDWGYALHFSLSRTTLGCIRIVNEGDMMHMKIMVENCILRNEPVILEVV